MRDSNEFEVMKGFLGDFVEKGSGTSPETLPPATTGDPHLGENLDEKGNTKKGKRGSVGGGTPMNDTLDDIASAAASDIESGYVNDTQKGKGYDLFNEMTAKGALVDDLTIKKYEVGASLKEIENSIVTKGLPHNVGSPGKVAGAVSAVREAITPAVNAIKEVGKKASETAVRVGSKTENKLRTGNKALTRMGVSEGGGPLYGAANLTGRHRKATGAVVMGTPVAVGGIAGEEAIRRSLKEEKGFDKKIETKSLSGRLASAAKRVEDVEKRVQPYVSSAKERAGLIGSKTENLLRGGNKALTRMGVSEGGGPLYGAANLVGRHRKATGAAVVGAPVVGAGIAGEEAIRRSGKKENE